MVARRLSAEERDAFVHVPTVDRTRVRVVVVRWLSPGVAGMTLDRWVLVRRGHEHDPALLAHELVHVRQWRERGRLQFLVSYVRDYARGRLRGLGHRDAYRAISFEIEARTLAAGLPAG